MIPVWASPAGWPCGGGASAIVVSAPETATSTQRMSGPIGSSTTFSKPSGPTEKPSARSVSATVTQTRPTLLMLSFDVTVDIWSLLVSGSQLRPPPTRELIGGELL